MKKFFEDQAFLYECTARDIEGRTHELSISRVTPEAIDNVPGLCAKYDNSKKMREKNKIVCKLMAYLFGGKPKDYANFSHRMCFKIVTDVNDTLQSEVSAAAQNPTTGQTARE